MDHPVVSFCIPTWNRGRYLRSLFEMLESQLEGFPFPYEVVVSDNHSTDDTPEVVTEYEAVLPMRAFRQAENIGSSANWYFVMGQARGTYVVYLADDDALMAEPLADALRAMLADPGIGVAYAPWMLYDLVDDRAEGTFYTQDRDLHIARGDHRTLLDALLRWHVFPEIYVCRRDLLEAVMPRVPEQAFYAFVHAAEFLQRADVLMLKDPFYVSITRYFADEQRTQTGTREAEHAWDRYRGGLEHVLGRFSADIREAERIGWCLRIQDMIADRIAVAVRLRNAQGRDAVETYYLAYRLKALGREALLPAPMESLRSGAAIDFLLRDEQLNRNVSCLVLQGDFDVSVREFVSARAAVPVLFVDQPLQGEDLVGLKDTLVLCRAPGSGFEPALRDRLDAANVRVLFEHDLMAKFAA